MVLREDEIVLERERLKELKNDLLVDFEDERYDYKQFRDYTFEDYLVFLYDHMCAELRAFVDEIKRKEERK